MNDAWKVAISANLGWALELYDLLTFIYVSTAIAPLFFPSSSYAASLLEALITLVIGYFARPIGAIVLAHFGDKLGRKTYWLISLLGMGLATLLIGFLPTYQSIGIAATILIVILRFGQGFFLGGEWAGGMTITTEFAPNNRRGFFGGISQAGAALGGIFGSAAIALASFLAPTTTTFDTIGWRIVFWFGLLPLLIAFIVRWSIGESPVWEKEAKLAVEKIPIATALRKYWKFIVIAVVVIFGEALYYYSTLGYMGTLLPLLNFSPGETSLVILVSSAVWLFTSPFFGLLSDNIGTRKKILITFYIIMAVINYPLFLMMTSRSLGLAIVSGAIMGLIFGAQYAVLPAWLAESIETKVRYSGIGLIINVGVAFSSFAPYISTFLLFTGISQAVATSLVGIIGGLLALIFVIPAPRERVGEALF
ncbi:MFS transporter [Sulfolobales archaeon HS-7]|nr:MFS transporter [Sulfolobales archaeon HS-7]